ncbi:hypothetical protein G9A89_023248 [Geosiphon pyriformis]|nr:hypothetical protein G9A89_023248 [Geosiphon pyriformis]
MSNFWKRVDVYYNHYNKHTRAKKRPKTSGNIWCSLTETTQQNNFKVATTPDATTLEYYQSIYTHCKQRFNISDGIEVVKKSVYQYIENCINNYLFGNYNISEVRSNLYNNLVHYLQLKTEDLNSKTLVTYFQELNFNIIKYCEETYPVQSQYFIDFESETETSNKGKQKLKQYSKTITNTPILPKKTAKHLQTPEQRTSSKFPLTITSFPASLTQAQTPNSPLNRFARLEDFTSPKSPIRQQEPLQTTANKENDSKISEEESIDSKNEKDEMTAYITKISEFNEEDIETSLQEWLNQVIKAGDANGWNAARMLKEQQSCHYCGILGHWKSDCRKLQQDQQNRSNQCYPPPQQSYYQPPPPAYYPPRPQYQSNYYQSAPQLIQQQYQQPSTQHYQVPTRKLILQNQFTPQNQYQVNNNRINSNNQLVPQNPAQPRPNHYYTQPSYLTIPEEQDFYHTSLSESRAAAQQQNPSYTSTTIPPARIAENANLSDIFSFEFEANESLFLLSNAAANKQKAITAMYTETEVEGKAICLILDSGSTGSIITYQLMQQLKRNVD